MKKKGSKGLPKYFEPDFGLNLNRLAIPVNPYEVFKCDVPNMCSNLQSSFLIHPRHYEQLLHPVSASPNRIYSVQQLSLIHI